ncbi:lipid-A-disaccharide synthase [Pseudoteredinibacter isoporae]|uniref:Lipid-A-disaccharide synthase n=1 Tax=Pseudoteredinibacter isoporae TaxID=570281 RepID=A0A7X0MW15_9GAMM|nr:lipid-A-disaccharide synthase [Pseudoteredinibacter isoporae]MBB6522316.1 lipid-A-disaccharide synthase [Pseudoteredinibacter isoporae]NHO87849.1 lipid-A-disaccharide synthase [Pseudoteredinibacter isoporae]NIB23820.1 lipid-A-disaccharide synthase [Pseudoteredinibacter isoporae]
MHIAIVVGEMSGDILGADLMRALQQRYPEASFSGIGGERMLALGFESFFPQDRLAVMGFIEPLKRLPELLRIRKFLRQHYLANPPDVFIGIDSPDFNLPIEKTLKAANIPTVHYVSPSVWAWRQGRIHGIKQSVDLMLTILPFETKIYHEHEMPVQFVGHPLADDFPVEPETENARAALGASPDEHIVALLPGSRSAEVKHLAPVFFDAAVQYAKKRTTRFLMPAANEARLEQIQSLLTELKKQEEYAELSIDIRLGNSKQIMCAADGVLMASGTTSLEALLLKKPMVVAYKKDWFSAWLTRRLIKTPFISLPNLLAGEALVPEILQEECTAENLAKALEENVQDGEKKEQLLKRFYDIHHQLRQDAGLLASEAIDKMLAARE